MKDQIADPEAAATICALLTTGRREDCISGMTGIVAFHNASIEAARAWCANRDGVDRIACETTIASLRFLFDK